MLEIFCILNLCNVSTTILFIILQQHLCAWTLDTSTIYTSKNGNYVEMSVNYPLHQQIFQELVISIGI